MISTDSMLDWTRSFLKSEYWLYVDGRKSPLRFDRETAEQTQRFLESFGHWVEIEAVDVKVQS